MRQKRFIVIEEIADKFTKLFVQNVKEEIVGDPMDKKTTVGPLVRDSQRQALIKQVDDSKLKHADILLGGNIIDGSGYYYEPTVISNLNHEMDILREEVFGPVAPIIIVKNEAEGIIEANNSEFGLGVSIWTSSFERGLKLAREIQTKVVKINEMVRSDPRLPFGGVKYSGIGRAIRIWHKGFCQCEIDSSKRHHNQITCGVRNTIFWLKRKNVQTDNTHRISDLSYTIRIFQFLVAIDFKILFNKMIE
ncbi:MAG: aldehyde dehydrogenase family protein [Nitrososphaeraceae archaeon]